MIQTEELVFVVDEHNNPLKPELRSVAHEKKLWHRTTGVWVINQDLQILCQKRSMKKDMKPGFWSSFFGGHLGPGETYEHNAVQELSEELGITLQENELIPYHILQTDKSRHAEFQKVFAVILNPPPLEFRFEKEEMDEVRWFNLDDLTKTLVEEKHENWVVKSWCKEVLNLLPTLK